MIKNSFNFWLLTGKFCGKSLPQPLVSPSNTMVVSFKSDGLFTSKGFKAMYRKLIQPTDAPAANTSHSGS